jgi:pantetheine-phosphate adenylyltransferase
MSQRTAIYPGTFDPITNGHLDVIERARRCFDHVVVAISQHPGKTPMLPLEDRMALVKEVVKDLEGVEADSFDGLLVDYVARIGGGVVVKGLRGPADIEYESQMAQMNADMTGMETLFLVSAPAVSFISSSLVREIARFGGDVTKFVPAEVARKMKESSRGEA